MGWADRAIAELLSGRETTIRPRGQSMKDTIPSGSLVVVRPRTGLPNVGDVVLCRVAGQQYLHFAAAISGEKVRIETDRATLTVGLPRATSTV